MSQWDTGNRSCMPMKTTHLPHVPSQRHHAALGGVTTPIHWALNHGLEVDTRDVIALIFVADQSERDHGVAEMANRRVARGEFLLGLDLHSTREWQLRL